VNKKLHVCIDGLNIALSKGTGIATYARNLANQLHQANYRVSLLFDKKLKENTSNLLYEVLFYNALNPSAGNERAPRYHHRLPLRSPIYLCKNFLNLLKSPSGKEHEFPGIVEDQALKTRLPSFNSVYNIQDIYQRSRWYFWMFGELLSIKLSPTPDIMHWTAPIPARVIGAKNYYTIHDIIPLKLPHATTDNKKYFYHMLLKIAHTADQLITVSEFSKNDISTHIKGTVGRIMNTYQGLHIEDNFLLNNSVFSVNQLKIQFGLSPQDYFLFVGAIEPKKNVTRLLEGYLSANVKQCLVVVGPLAWQSEKERRLLKQYSPRVIYLNYVSSEIRDTLLSHARALVFPSLFEGFGLPVIEAMSMGVPVITSNISSLPEIAGDAAYLVNPYSVYDIAASIQRLSTDDDLCAMLSKNGKERATYFSLDAYAKRLEEIYPQEM